MNPHKGCFQTPCSDASIQTTTNSLGSKVTAPTCQVRHPLPPAEPLKGAPGPGQKVASTLNWKNMLGCSKSTFLGSFFKGPQVPEGLV